MDEEWMGESSYSDGLFLDFLFFILMIRNKIITGLGYSIFFLLILLFNKAVVYFVCIWMRYQPLDFVPFFCSLLRKARISALDGKDKQKIIVPCNTFTSDVLLLSLVSYFLYITCTIVIFVIIVITNIITIIFIMSVAVEMFI